MGDVSGPVGLRLAEIIARAIGLAAGGAVTPDHLLRAIGLVPRNLAAHYLRRLGVSMEAVEVADSPSGQGAAALRRAAELAGPGQVVHEGHLLLALVQGPGGTAPRLLPRAAQRRWLELALRNDAPFMAGQPRAAQPLGALLAQLAGAPGTPPQAGQGQGEAEEPEERPEAWLRDLTALASQGQLDPLVGRRGELMRLQQALCRRNKRGAVVVGAPGVGKRALIHGLAQALARGQVPAPLLGLRLVELDATALVGGTRYRGELEARVNSLGKQLAAQGRSILFIDGLDQVAGQPGAQGASETGQLLAGLLAQCPTLRLLATAGDGGSNTNVYERIGLANRLARISLPSATKAETLEIISALKARYEDFHNVTYSHDALKACISLAYRYLTSRQLPDSALDVLDETGAHAALFLRKPTLRMQVLQQLIQRDENLLSDPASVGNRKNRGASQKQLQLLQKEFKKEQELWLKRQAKIRLPIDAELVAQVVSDMSGIPIERVRKNEQDRLLGMAQHLQKRVIGQQNAIDVVTRAIQRSRVGLRDPKRPIGAFLFLGPTGVGKTLLAKALAEFLFDSQDNFIRLDMGEYTEAASVSRLLGASPGYVGYEQGGQLTEQVFKRPYSVVLLDEIEKAAPAIYSTLLQLLDDGRLTDGQGRLVDFKNTLIIMTSNVGSRQLAEFGEGVGYSTAAQRNQSNANRQHVIDRALQQQFAPEFLNRIDEIIHFRTLAPHDLEKIIDLELAFIEQRLASRRLSFRLTPAAKARILELSYDRKYGARPLRRALQQQVEDVLTDYLLHHLDAEELSCLLDLGPDRNLFVKETKSVNVPALPAPMLRNR